MRSMPDPQATRSPSPLRLPGEGRARRWLWAALAMIALLAALASGARVLFSPSPAPDVRLTTTDGGTVSLADWRGEVVLVEFWATTCAICVAEMPAIDSLHRDLRGRGLRVVAVAMSYDRPDHVLAYARRVAPSFTIAIDPYGEAQAALGPVPGTPTRLLVDRDGLIVARLIGRADIARLRDLIEQALNRPAQSAG
ncbi:MAG: TlpA family protein disulfide reductase [Burkholderiaceae bacterium]|nr:TlpA family protein disulfide reductase [Burkholderiaceae bacterium]